MPKSLNSKPSTASPWLHGPVWDIMAGCGGWSLPIIAVTTLLAASFRVEIGAAFYFLAVFCNNPHYMATLHRAYGGRKEFNRYKVFSLYLTSLILIAGISAHLAPALIPWLITIYLVWSPWHYTGQNFGIALTLSRRAELTPSRDARNLLYLSYLGSYLVWLVDLFDTAPVGSFAIPLEFPPALVLPVRLGGYLLFFLAGTGAFISLIRQSKSLSQLLAPALLHSSQFLWFMLPGLIGMFQGSDSRSLYFSAGALAFMHCAQYLWITSYYAKRKALSASPPKKLSFFAYFGVLALGGIALFTPGPWLVSILFRQDLFQSALVFTALVNIHHFMLDGAIWKLRDNRISRILFGNAPHHHHDEHGAETPKIFGWLFGPGWIPKTLRYGTALSLIAFAFADQSLNLLTLQGASREQVAVAERLNPNDSRVQFRLAQHQAADGNANAAIATLDDALESSPHNLALAHFLAELQFKQGRIDDAKRSYDLVLELAPSDLAALTNRGLIAHSERDWPRSIELLRRATETAPHHPASQLALAESLYHTSEYDSAIPHFEAYLAYASEFPDSIAPRSLLSSGEKLSQCFTRLGRVDEARALTRSLAQVQRALASSGSQ